jgi:hypothetical protein
MSNEITSLTDFAVARTSKAGKTTYRTMLGVITSGNAAERHAAAGKVVATMIANGNFRHLLREVERVFPVSLLKKSNNAQVRDGALWFVTYSKVDGVSRMEMEEYTGWIGANKKTALKLAEIIQSLGINADLAGKPFKGEKAMYRDFLVEMLVAEQERLDAVAVEADDVVTVPVIS